MGGVDRLNGYREDQEGKFHWPDDATRWVTGTDRNRSRQAAAVDFIGDLNGNDWLVVIAFQEQEAHTGLDVLCSAPPLEPTGDLADEPEYVRQAINCFGVNRGIVEDAVRQHYGREGGRTPLWSAVRAAWELLQRGDLDVPANRHIVVIGDGPDTCTADTEEFVRYGVEEEGGLAGPMTRPACSSVSYATLRDQLTSQQEASGAVPVHIHFVQLQAAGYREPDPRQQELACLTAGHHVFIDARNVDPANPSWDLETAIGEALRRVRASFAGHWVVQARVPALGAPDALAPGALHALTGSFTLRGGTFGREDRIFRFDGGGTRPSESWDQRPAFRRGCESDEQCGAMTEACRVHCSPEQALCLLPPALAPDGEACQDASGITGACEAGACAVP